MKFLGWARPTRFSILSLAIVFSLLFSDRSFAAGAYDLFGYMESHVAINQLPAGVAPYNRKLQFGGWRHQDPRFPCHDTREMVLERSEDPQVPIQFRLGGCSIEAGLWHDPYTGMDFTSARDVQIDHVVPLKNAYHAGAYHWNDEIRCNYANFLANPIHLRAVSGHENMSKGDRSPEGYMPPNPADQCPYLSDWMKIKMIWQLTFTLEEAQGVEALFARNGCDQYGRYVDADWMAQQQQYAATPIAACTGGAQWMTQDGAE